MAAEDRAVVAGPVGVAETSGYKSGSSALVDDDDEDIENKELDIKVDDDAEADLTKEDEDKSSWYLLKVRLVFICVLLFFNDIGCLL